MTPTLRPLALAAAVLAGACLSPAARAAESYDNCTGFIDSLPATITTQGVWCVRKNLTTSMATGTAITIAGNNITIDCNDFKVGGMAAGTGSQAVGIHADARQNATVRRCGVRGFFRGIWLDGSGHLVEDNRLDGNLYVGVQIGGTGNRVERNRVFDTGGNAVFAVAYGIYGAADIVDNAVENVYANGVNTYAWGIVATGSGGLQVADNRVRGLLATGTGDARGITASGAAAVVSGNAVSGTATPGIGVDATGANTFCTGNVVHGFGTAYSSCDHAAGNLPVLP